MRAATLCGAVSLFAGAAWGAQPIGPAPADQYGGVPPISPYRGGAGSPFSPNASNIDPSDTRSEIAPRLPDPAADGEAVRDFLVAADRALAQRRTGAAQEALERAQTRVLSRSTDPALANVPDGRGAARAITEARQSLAHEDLARARAILAELLDAGR